MKTRNLSSIFAVLTLVVISNLFINSFAMPIDDDGGHYVWFVRDQSNNPVSGATVTLEGKNYNQSLTSGPSGRVDFFGVPNGTYTISACYQGTGRLYSDFVLPNPGIGTDQLVLQSNVTFCPSW